MGLSEGHFLVTDERNHTILPKTWLTKCHYSYNGLAFWKQTALCNIFFWVMCSRTEAGHCLRPTIWSPAVKSRWNAFDHILLCDINCLFSPNTITLNSNTVGHTLITSHTTDIQLSSKSEARKHYARVPRPVLCERGTCSMFVLQAASPDISGSSNISDSKHQLSLVSLP